MSDIWKLDRVRFAVVLPWKLSWRTSRDTNLWKRVMIGEKRHYAPADHVSEWCDAAYGKNKWSMKMCNEYADSVLYVKSDADAVAFTLRFLAAQEEQE